MCEAQWSTLLTSKPRRRRLRLLSETRCSALHIQGRDPRTPSGGEGRVQRREPPPQTPGAQHLGRRAISPRAAVPHTGSVETANACPVFAACHWSRAAQRSAAAALSCPTCGEMPGDTGGPQAPTPFTLHKLGSWGWGSWEPLRSQLLRGGVRFTISRCSLVTRVQFQLQNLRFICVLFSSFHGNPHGSQSSAQEEWLAAPSSPASCQAFREERGGPETGPASGSAGRGRGPQGSRSAQGLRASLAWRGAIFPITGQQTEAQGKALAPSPTGWQD